MNKWDLISNKQHYLYQHTKQTYITYKTNETCEGKLQNTEGKSKDLNKWNKIPCL